MVWVWRHGHMIMGSTWKRKSMVSVKRCVCALSFSWFIFSVFEKGHSAEPSPAAQGKWWERRREGLRDSQAKP